jgi:hypothetical protein
VSAPAGAPTGARRHRGGSEYKIERLTAQRDRLLAVSIAALYHLAGMARALADEGRVSEAYDVLQVERRIEVEAAAALGLPLCSRCGGEGHVERDGDELPGMVSPRILCRPCVGRGVQASILPAVGFRSPAVPPRPAHLGRIPTFEAVHLMMQVRARHAARVESGGGR